MENIATPEIKKSELFGGKPHRYEKGWEGGPGRPKGSKAEKTLLHDAIKLVEQDPKTICSCQYEKDGTKIKGVARCKTLREHFIRRGFASEAILPSVMKKVEPDLVQETGQRSPSVVNIVYNFGPSSALQNRVQAFQQETHASPS